MSQEPEATVSVTGQKDNVPVPEQYPAQHNDLWTTTGHRPHPAPPWLPGQK